MKKIKNLKVRLVALTLLTSSVISLSGCTEEQDIVIDNRYDILQNTEDGTSIANGLTQILDVPGRDFKLVTNYTCDDATKREWKITSDKFLYFNVYTQGLPAGTEVYIDNIHIDTSIKAQYDVMDGILQDSMDDHVHSSQLIGFPISDTTRYYGVNAIEGSNETFIKGSFHGFNGYSSGSVSERRYEESDYLNKGVYGNKIMIVYDLLIKGPNDVDFANVSVPTDFLVLVSSLETKENGNQKTK